MHVCACGSGDVCLKGLLRGPGTLPDEYSHQHLNSENFHGCATWEHGFGDGDLGLLFSS